MWAPHCMPHLLNPASAPEDPSAAVGRLFNLRLTECQKVSGLFNEVSAMLHMHIRLSTKICSPCLHGDLRWCQVESSVLIGWGHTSCATRRVRLGFWRRRLPSYGLPAGRSSSATSSLPNWHSSSRHSPHHQITPFRCLLVSCNLASRGEHSISFP